MRRSIWLLGSGALTLVGLGATLIVQGGWQAVAAAFAILQGLVFASSLIALQMAAEHPRARRPSWAVAGGAPRAEPAATEAERLRADVRVKRAERAPRVSTS